MFQPEEIIKEKKQRDCIRHTQHSWKEHEVVLALEKECDIQCTSLENIHNPHLQNSVSAIVDENALK